MDEVDYIYDFLHDPTKNRWKPEIVDYLLSLAEEDITSKVEAFLKARDINRDKAQLSQLGTDTKTVILSIVDGTDIYTLPEEFLRITSVIYEGCFIPHQVPTCGDGVDCGEDTPDQVIKSYNVSGLPKGKIKISPLPQKWTQTETITHCKTVEVISDSAMYGWELFNVDPKKQISDVCTQETVCTELTFGELAVTYEIPKDLEFDDTSNEDILSALVSDRQLRKYYVCGHLLRDDKDSHSRTLGGEELVLFDARLTVMLGKYADLYEQNNILEIESAKEGFIDSKTNEDILGRDQVEAEKALLEEAKRKSQARNQRSKFECLGVR